MSNRYENECCGFKGIGDALSAYSTFMVVLLVDNDREINKAFLNTRRVGEWCRHSARAFAMHHVTPADMGSGAHLANVNWTEVAEHFNA